MSEGPSAVPVEPHLAAAAPKIDIFISYSRTDRERIRPLVEVLEARGWSVWWDQDILPGRTWDEVIEAAIEAARCVVVVWSAASVLSDWVRLEAAVAKDRGVLVPIRLDEVALPLAFRRIQTAVLLGWTGEASHQGLAETLLAIANLLSPSRQPETTIPLPLVEKRSLDAAMPRFIEIGRTVELIAMIRRADCDGLKVLLEIEEHPSISKEDVVSRRFSLEFPVNIGGRPQSASVVLRLDSPDFLPREQQKKILLRPGGESQICTFLMAATREGELVVNLEVYRAAEMIASRVLRTNGIQRPELPPAGRTLVTLPLVLTATPIPGNSGATGIFKPREFTISYQPAGALPDAPPQATKAPSGDKAMTAQRPVFTAPGPTGTGEWPPISQSPSRQESQTPSAPMPSCLLYAFVASLIGVLAVALFLLHHHK